MVSWATSLPVSGSPFASSHVPSLDTASDPSDSKRCFASPRATLASASASVISSATNFCSAWCKLLPTANPETPSRSSTLVWATPLTNARVTISTPSTACSDPFFVPTARPNASQEIWNVPSACDCVATETSPEDAAISESDGGKNSTRVVSTATDNAVFPKCALTPQNGTENKATAGVGPRNAPYVHIPVNAVHVAAKPISGRTSEPDHVLESPVAAGGMTISSAPRVPLLAVIRDPAGGFTARIATNHAGGAGIPVTPLPRKVLATTPGGN
mmetsp:Transcript_6312/g.23795  ORF Transcript_6312/g.23795 Transcript_6312/m.23795 type:complete len:273 (-) Transcript_6312:698-1516(-)